ncbi:type VI secretion system-associated protein TagF [Rhizobium mongolense]|uniref:Type VI secretion system protein ImpM n=1 Tax=Rhizobium mongolense TaxID=57676 RepID=A0A7W6RN90_9HYPH|nr:type VI secretion system-associated protein TagF [Rhizobium mongolense]MBB4275620.1 type VI secretion system protein ImpM [Rhizobium mongolense]
MNGATAVDAKAAETDRIGFFGKVPTHGDFVSSGLDTAVRSELDRWLQNGLSACAHAFGEQWQQQFGKTPSWRFIVEAGIWSRSAVAGVLSPSKDRVGRSFPLVIAAQLRDFTDHPRQLYLDATWFTAAEGLAETVGNRDFDIGHFSTMLKRLRLPRTSEGESGGGAGSPPTSLWWQAEPGTGKVIGFRTAGAPKAEDFMRLLGGTEAVKESLLRGAAAISPPAPPKPPVRPRLVIERSHATHAGTRLSSNADALLVSDEPPLFSIADGVGDGLAAVKAARLTINALSAIERPQTIEAFVQDIKGKLGRAHGLLQSAAATEGREPPLASIAVTAILDGFIAVLWAGDVRCYLVRDGMMRCLTRDHVEVGIRRVVTNAVGLRRQLVPDVLLEEARPGDRLMLCSAPLARIVPERGIAEILLSASAREAAEILVQEGLIGNCRDNLSAVVIELKSP